MKKYIWVLFAIIILAGTSCQETIDIEKEKNAIIAVIQEEGDAFAANDLDRISAIHIQGLILMRLFLVGMTLKNYMRAI